VGIKGIGEFVYLKAGELKYTRLAGKLFMFPPVYDYLVFIFVRSCLVLGVRFVIRFSFSFKAKCSELALILTLSIYGELLLLIMLYFCIRKLYLKLHILSLIE